MAESRVPQVAGGKMLQFGRKWLGWHDGIGIDSSLDRSRSERLVFWLSVVHSFVNDDGGEEAHPFAFLWHVCYANLWLEHAPALAESTVHEFNWRLTLLVKTPVKLCRFHWNSWQTLQASLPLDADYYLDHQSFDCKWWVWCNTSTH